jgi:hypothetical protein
MEPLLLLDPKLLVPVLVRLLVKLLVLVRLLVLARLLVPVPVLLALVPHPSQQLLIHQTGHPSLLTSVVLLLLDCLSLRCACVLAQLLCLLLLQVLQLLLLVDAQPEL